MRITTLAKFAVFILFGIFSFTYGCAATGTPRESLSKLRSALLNHDADTALLYIDVDSITDHLAEDVLNRLGTSDDVLASLGATVGKNVQPLLFPVAREAIKNQVRKAISSTKKSGYFDYIRKAHIFYLNITMEGDDRVLVEPKGKSDFAFRMAKTEQGYWKIVQLVLNKKETR